MKRVKAAILISGRGSNMEAIIKNTHEGKLKGVCEIALVLSNKPEVPGLHKAELLGIETKVIASKGKTRTVFDTSVVQLLKIYSIDYVILAGYDRILSPLFVSAFKNRIINIHPADTNAYQGLHGYQWAFENHLKETKITVHLVDEGVDTGRILAQRTIDISGCATLEEIEQLGLQTENVFYSEVLEKFFKNSK